MMAGRSSRSTVASLMTRSPVVVTEDDAIAGAAELLAAYEITDCRLSIAMIAGRRDQSDGPRPTSWIDAPLGWLAWTDGPRPDDHARQDDLSVSAAR
jgi:hypothetical protein